MSGLNATPKEDGYDLWLRYRLVQPAELLAAYRQQVHGGGSTAGGTAAAVAVPGDSPTMAAIRSEMQRGLAGLLGEPVDIGQDRLQQGGVLIGTPATSPQIAALGWQTQIEALGAEGYKICSTQVEGPPAIVVAAQGELGALYGAFHLLRLLQTHQPLADLDITERPRIQYRMLDHWDNLDGSIERGYAGRSLWKWRELPGVIDPRYRDYARACASIGINAAALNNTNARSESLSAEYLRKAAAVAGVLRPYGVRVFLSVRFSAPMELGGLDTADPLDDEVLRWWRTKADEIYQVIPDLGGFLIKADSEGQPGPFGYKRTHADGANALAQAVAPHGGIVMWRAFVYGHGEADRAKSAYATFKPLDGDFAPNVMVQAKNGPIDFQPREPVQPLFGAMPRTPLAMEFQITQEYLGQSIHLVYLAPMWKEILDWDTFAQGEGSTVGRVIDGSLHGQALSGIAGIANIGSNRNWCGHHFAQANWYAFGRLAWDHQLSSETIAQEWIRATFTHDAQAVASILNMMMSSWEACVNDMTPLGLHHIMREGHHYGPDPSYDAGHRADWRSTYYHRADTEGLGFDRSSRGSNAVEQYCPPLRELFDDLASCPEKYLVWFHHVPWTHKLRSGRTLWEELVWLYVQGVEAVSDMLESWETLEASIDPQRYREVLGKLVTHLAHAAEWPRVCLPYFQRFSHQPIPTAASGLVHDVLGGG